MPSVIVNLKKNIDNSYEIIIGKELLISINYFIRKYDKIVVITDDNLKKIFNDFLYRLDNVSILSFISGEESKNVKTYCSLIEKCFKLGLTRKSLIVAFGGGVVGDLSGHVAATYMRGIEYIQVPTSLLAMVDSSVGGKVGYDVVGGKNMVGSFWQPKKVFIDVDLLSSLSITEYQNGLAEVIKYAIIKDKVLYKYLVKNKGNVLSKNLSVVTSIIQRSCEIKKEIVELDEREINLRKILNFGHTIGHAIESVSGYKVKHGVAIAKGMYIEGKIAFSLGYLDKESMVMIENIFKLYGFDLKCDFDVNDLVSIMKSDKKNVGKDISFVFPEKIGTMHKINNEYGISVSEGVVEKVLNDLCNNKGK